ncbi:MAG: uracil-DNA glycosylase [Candidatus Pacearchaeota archaeon]
MKKIKKQLKELIINSKIKQLEILKKRCIKSLKCRVVFDNNSVNIKIMFVGESPGKQELKIGKPFVGRAGKFLQTEMKKIGLTRKKVYITNVLKCKTKLSKENISKHSAFLFQQIRIIKPKIILLLGKIATETLLKKPFNKVRGKIIDIKGKKYIATFHPSAAQRFPKIRKLFEKDFFKLKNLI